MKYDFRSMKSDFQIYIHKSDFSNSCVIPACGKPESSGFLKGGLGVSVEGKKLLTVGVLTLNSRL